MGPRLRGKSPQKGWMRPPFFCLYGAGGAVGPRLFCSRPQKGGGCPLWGRHHPLEGGTAPKEGPPRPFEGRYRTVGDGAAPKEGATSPKKGSTVPLGGATSPFWGGAGPFVGARCPLEGREDPHARRSVRKNPDRHNSAEVAAWRNLSYGVHLHSPCPGNAARRAVGRRGSTAIVGLSWSGAPARSVQWAPPSRLR